jgi:hypothetical protein
MKRVCAFLEIPYNDGLTTLEGAHRDAIHEGEHHKLLRGTRIVSERKPQVLPEALRRKIERYISLWRQIHQTNWPTYPMPQAEKTGPPGMMERGMDWVCYRGWRAVDAFTRVVYCHIPLGPLRWYRNRKSKRG